MILKQLCFLLVIFTVNSVSAGDDVAIEASFEPSQYNSDHIVLEEKHEKLCKTLFGKETINENSERTCNKIIQNKDEAGQNLVEACGQIKKPYQKRCLDVALHEDIGADEIPSCYKKNPPGFGSSIGIRVKVLDSFKNCLTSGVGKKIQTAENKN